MRPYREAADEGAQIGCFSIPIIILIAVTLILVGLAANAAYYGTLTFFLNQEAQAQRASPQYTEAKRTLLIRLEQEYEQPTATDGQKAAILARMREERALIPPGDVPPGVAAFIARNGG